MKKSPWEKKRPAEPDRSVGSPELPFKVTKKSAADLLWWWMDPCENDVAVKDVVVCSDAFGAIIEHDRRYRPSRWVVGLRTMTGWYRRAKILLAKKDEEIAHLRAQIEAIKRSDERATELVKARPRKKPS